MRFELRRTSANVIPGRLRTNENVLRNLHTRITIHAAKRQPVDGTVKKTA